MWGHPKGWPLLFCEVSAGLEAAGLAPILIVIRPDDGGRGYVQADRRGPERTVITMPIRACDVAARNRCGSDGAVATRGEADRRRLERCCGLQQLRAAGTTRRISVHARLVESRDAIAQVRVESLRQRE